MLGLANAIHPRISSSFVTFYEDGLYKAFLTEVKRNGFEGDVLEYDTPRLLAALGKLIQILREWKADILLCHNTKPNLLGLMAARRISIPVISVSHGWTGETLRVQVADILDRRVLRWMDRVVSVSKGQARKVLKAGITADKSVVICDAVCSSRFANPLPEFRNMLEEYFLEPPKHIVGAAGRLSPEKGFTVLVNAAAEVIRRQPSVGFVLFGEGAMRDAIAKQINKNGISSRFILAGFRSDLDNMLPHLDLLVQSSFTEGLPNVVLEAYAAGVPVVATAVGGTPEIIEDGINGFLVPPDQPLALANRIVDILSDDARRCEMAAIGRRHVKERFSFDVQAQSYRNLFHELFRNGRI